MDPSVKPVAVYLAAAVAFASAGARAMHYPGEGRRTTPHDFAVELQRFELPNGLVVLLSPDPAVSSVLVWTSFRAGTLYEPPGRSGMAHLVEHLMASGPTPETSYELLLERRGARYFNASTTFETMTFETVVPANELALALWVAADRLGSLPPLIDAARVERERRVVLQERAVTEVDAPYGLVDAHLYKRLFAAPHPLHGSVGGVPAELARVTAGDVQEFAAQYLVPANGVVTVVGRFDPAEARRLIEDGLGRLPAGHRARMPSLPRFQVPLVDSKEEIIAREPRVTVAWRLARMGHDEAMALRVGAQLLSFLLDGAFGMRLAAHLEEYSFESVFQLALTVPYDEPASAVQSDAEGFLRQLTGREVPFDLLKAANLALDGAALFHLDSLEGRAYRLTRLELLGTKMTVAQDCTGHWRLDPPAVRDMAREYLNSPRVVVHARPLHPRPARRERE